MIYECSLNSVHMGSYIYSELTPIYLMYVHGCTIYCEMNNCLLNCLHNHSPGKHINDYFGLVLFVVVGCHRYLWKMVTVVWWNISIENLMFICFTTQKNHGQNIKSTWIVRHNKITLYLTWQHNPTNDDLATIFPYRRACPTHSVYVRGRSYDDAIINYAVHMKAYGMFSNSL